MDTELAPPPLVLMYHSVEAYDQDPYRVTVRPWRFARQLRWLRRRGLRGVAMSELLRARREGGGERLVGLTFDDGYGDFVTEVLPALRRYGWTATVFVVAGALGDHNRWDEPGPRKPLMTAGQVRQVAAEGIEIGSHSVSHARLPEVSAGRLADEVARSRSVLAELAGGPVDGFCYPYGSFGAREVEAVRAAGYGYACAAGRPAVAGRHALPRTFVGDRDGSARLFAKVVRHRLSSARGAR